MIFFTCPIFKRRNITYTKFEHLRPIRTTRLNNDFLKRHTLQRCKLLVRCAPWRSCTNWRLWWPPACAARFVLVVSKGRKDQQWNLNMDSCFRLFEIYQQLMNLEVEETRYVAVVLPSMFCGCSDDLLPRQWLALVRRFLKHSLVN